MEKKFYARTDGLVTDSVLTNIFYRAFLVPKPGTNTWRLVMDFRWLNSHCEVPLQDGDIEEAAEAGQAERLVLQFSNSKTGTTSWGAEWSGRRIWRSPTRAKVHTHASLVAWGGVLDLKHATQGFWAYELRHLRSTHLELKVVHKTVQSFPWELTGGNLGHPPWSLLHEVAHKLREERCAATVVAPYWPGQMWFQQLEALANEVDILLSYNLQKARQATVVARQPKLAQGSKVRVYWPVDGAWYSGAVGETSADGLTHLSYDDGDEEHLAYVGKEEYDVAGRTRSTAAGERLG
eukprot:gene6668-biopygen6722